MLDHLVYATPNLIAAVRDVEQRLGVLPSTGGQHVAWGTRNYLLMLGGGSYLELIGPDEDQPNFQGVRPFGLSVLERACLVSWAWRVDGIQARIEDSRAKGYDPGPVHSMGRRRPDGVLVRWELTDVPGDTVPALVPFLIDWGDSPHPSLTAARGATLVEFHGESPNAQPVRAALDALGVTLTLQQGNQTRLMATIQGPAGRVTLS